MSMRNGRISVSVPVIELAPSLLLAAGVSSPRCLRILLLKILDCQGARSRRDEMAEIITEMRINQNAADAMDAAIAEWLGVNRTDIICLDILARLGTVPAGRLAEESRLTTGAITAVLDRLERAGYVQRLADPVRPAPGAGRDDRAIPRARRARVGTHGGGDARTRAADSRGSSSTGSGSSSGSAPRSAIVAPKRSPPTATGAERSYLRFLLAIYDPWVIGFMTRAVWKVPVPPAVERYRRLMGRRHMDVGPRHRLLPREGRPAGRDRDHSAGSEPERAQEDLTQARGDAPDHRRGGRDEAPAGRGSVRLGGADLRAPLPAWTAVEQGRGDPEHGLGIDPDRGAHLTIEALEGDRHLRSTADGDEVGYGQSFGTLHNRHVLDRDLPAVVLENRFVVIEHLGRRCFDLELCDAAGALGIVEVLELRAAVGRDLLSQLQIVLRADPRTRRRRRARSRRSPRPRAPGSRAEGSAVRGAAGTSTRGGTSGVPIGLPTSTPQPRSPPGATMRSR